MIAGYALTYGVPYQRSSRDRLLRYTEIVERGAADRTSRGDNIILDVHHDGIPLASTRNGSLSLVSDRKGLWFAATLDRTWEEYDVDVAGIEQRVADGELSKCSWAGNPIDERWEDWHEHEADPMTAPVHRILELQVIALTLTNIPANLVTSARAHRSSTVRGTTRPITQSARIEYGALRGDCYTAAIVELRRQHAAASRAAT